MKGVILAGGTGSRLMPLTKIANKHLLPVYDRPMICYPLASLVKAGITDIMIVSGVEHAGQFIEFLGDGSEYGANIIYGCQTKAGGIAEAIMVAKSFVGKDPMCVILGDNIFGEDIKPWANKFKDSLYVPVPEGYPFDPLPPQQCHLVCKEVPITEAKNYGVLSDDGAGYGNIHIIEKPNYLTNGVYTKDTALAVTGLYFYTADVFHKIKQLKPSERGELEVSTLNDMYAASGDLKYSVTNGVWHDCGVDLDHLLYTGNEMQCYSGASNDS